LVTFAKIQRYSIALWKREMVWHCSDWEFEKRGDWGRGGRRTSPSAERKMIFLYFRKERKLEDGGATSEQ